MSSHSPKISVIIPVWNAAKNLPKLLDLLSRQTHKNLEILAIDDGSTDDSLKILRDFAKTDPRLKVVHQKNSGASTARNRGLDLATGDFISSIDSDDEITQDFLEKLLKAYTPDTALAVSGIRFNKLQTGEIVDAYLAPRRHQRKTERRADYILWLLARDGRLYSSVNKLFRHQIIRDANLRFDPGRDFAEDTKFVLDYIRFAPGQIAFVPEPLYIYNFGTTTSTVKTSSTLWRNWERSFRDLQNWVHAVNNGKLSLKTHFLLALIRLRWCIAWHKSKARLKKS